MIASRSRTVPRVVAREVHHWVCALVLVVAIVACGSATNPGPGSGTNTSGTPNGQTGGGSGSTNPNSSGTGPSSGSSNPPLGGFQVDGGPSAGSQCTGGSTRSCCTNGLQTCGGVEFAAWGPCLDRATGAVIASCPEAGAPPPPPMLDAGHPDFVDAGPPDVVDASSPPIGPPGCVCKPGSLRYCSRDQGVHWGKSVCDSTGTWGLCGPFIAPPGCTSPGYTSSCCSPLHVCCLDDILDIGGFCKALSCLPDGG
jgi:hypothetical protein